MDREVRKSEWEQGMQGITQSEQKMMVVEEGLVLGRAGKGSTGLSLERAKPYGTEKEQCVCFFQ